MAQYGHTLCVTFAPRRRDWMADVRGLIGSRFPRVPAAGESPLASELSVVLIGGPGVAQQAAEESKRDDRGGSRHVPVVSCSSGSSH
jgi:hypothetical protein